MKRTLALRLSILLIACSIRTANAQVTLEDPGFTVDVLSPRLEGSLPRIEAIRNSAYGGLGIVAANIQDSVLVTYVVESGGSVRILTSQQLDFNALGVLDVRFDHTGNFGHELFVGVFGNAPDNVDCEIYRMEPNGAISRCGPYFGAQETSIGWGFDFTTGDGGHIPGIWLQDKWGGGGADPTSMGYLDENCEYTRLAEHLVPPGRVDLDIRGLEFDPSGIYGFDLIMADSDANQDDISVIYALQSDLSWRTLGAPVSTTEIFYSDLAISPGGVFQQSLYVAARVKQPDESFLYQVLTVDAAGNHSVFASGFSEIGSLTIGADGSALFVADEDAIYHIHREAEPTGPTVVCQSPSIPANEVVSWSGPLRAARFVLSEPVIFSADDIAIVDEAGESVPFTIAGSGTQFLSIGFVAPLWNNRYSIVVHDTVISASTGRALDGDSDGVAGGSFQTVVEHRQRLDLNNDGVVDRRDRALLPRLPWK